MLGSILFRVRTLGRRHVPLSGGLIIASNHQSYLDPVLIGLGLPRQIGYLARETLFVKSRGFAWLMRSLNAIPIRREGVDLKAFREAVRRLKAGEALLMFPEGTRTRDGAVGPIRPGIWNLARRAGVPVMPAVVDGAFEAWPRGCRLPRLHPIRVLCGAPIGLAEIERTGSAGFPALLRGRLEDLLSRCRATRRR